MQKYMVRSENGPKPIPYYDFYSHFCDFYTIQAEVFHGLDCSVNSDLYPIPNWQVAGDGKGCSVYSVV